MHISDANKKLPLNCLFEPSGKNGLKTYILYESPCECQKTFENGERTGRPRSVPGMSQFAKLKTEEAIGRRGGPGQEDLLSLQTVAAGDKTTLRVMTERRKRL